MPQAEDRDRPRVVVLSPLVPYDAVPHAGGRYLQALHRLLADLADAEFLVPSTPTNRTSATKNGAPAALAVLGAEPARHLAGKAVAALLEKADRRLRWLDPGLPSLPMALALARPGPGRDAVRAADVVDLQWSESIRLLPLVRRLNPRARVVGTFHDVQSQLFSREPAIPGRGRRYWRAVSWRARRQERRAVRGLDEVLVFSAKDAALLGDPAHVRVVPPPLATGDETPRETRPGDVVLFVAHFARDENDKAGLWLLDEVWPRVVAAHPEANLRLVGSGMGTDLAAAAARAGVAAPGFVDDLAPEYAAARVVVVPLRQGAGVKFKTVEALLHDVPVVTTSVGAEGIDGPDLYAGLADDAAGLADALLAVLTDPAAQEERSHAAQAWARTAYGPEGFAEAVRAAYEGGRR